MPERTPANTLPAPEPEQTPLAVFRREMNVLVEAEKKKKQEYEKRGNTGEAHDPDYINVNADHLTELDRQIWEKIKTETATREDIEHYNIMLNAELENEPPEVQRSRRDFTMIIRNKATYISERQWKERTSRG